jgi:hypothetical protein
MVMLEVNESWIEETLEQLTSDLKIDLQQPAFTSIPEEVVGQHDIQQRMTEIKDVLATAKAFNADIPGIHARLSILEAHKAASLQSIRAVPQPMQGMFLTFVRRKRLLTLVDDLPRGKDLAGYIVKLVKHARYKDLDAYKWFKHEMMEELNRPGATWDDELSDANGRRHEQGQECSEVAMDDI